MKITALSLVLLFSSLILFSCKKDNPVIPPEPPPVDYRKITLADEGKSCTEIWIKITADSVELPSSITLDINNTTEDITLSDRKDTVLYFDSLQPNSGYHFSAVLSEDTTIKSTELQVNTLAPTSHSFTYQTFELGDPLSGYSSVLYGAAIIDENDIWVVGEIYLQDSLGQSARYNAAKWNGDQWDLKRIRYYGNCSAVEYPVLRAVFAFSSNEIILTNGSSIGWFDGSIVTLDCSINSLLTGSIYSIYGRSMSNLYTVGNKGDITHFDGSTWQSITSPTTLALTDIYSNGNGDIYSGAGNSFSGEGVLLKGNEDGVFTVMVEGGIIDESQLFRPNLYGPLGAVWIDENNTIYTGGYFLYRYKNNSWNYVTSLPENYLGGNPSIYRGVISAIRGNNVNDYIIAGGRNTLQHFNGVDWQQLGLPYDPSSDIVWRDIQMQGNTAIAVGNKGSNAFIILLNR